MGDSLITRSTLIERARAGDTSEFARLYAPLAYAIARKRGLNEHDAEDVMQQTMVELLRMLPNFQYDRSRGSFKGLIKKIVWNRTSDLLRKAKPAAPASQLDEIAEPDDELEKMFEREWRKAHLAVALDRVRIEVKPSTFQAFQLTVLSERSVTEAAEALGLSENQVSQNKRRVVQRLAAHLKELLK